MTEVVTLELPNPVALRAKNLAAETGQHFEAMLVSWIDHLATNPPLELLPDEQILALCELQMADDEQAALSKLLARQREDTLTDTDTQQLDRLMHRYRQGLVHKAQAITIAVKRGLRPPLSQQ